MTVLRGREAVTSRAEVLGDGAIRGEEPLGVSWGLEPLHPPLSLTGGLVRIFRAVIQGPVLAMFYAGQELSPGCPIALELIGDEPPWYIRQPFEEFAKEPFGRSLIATGLDQDIENIAMVIDRPPEVVPLAMNGQKYLIQMPLIAWPRTSTE